MSSGIHGFSSNDSLQSATPVKIDFAGTTKTMEIKVQRNNNPSALIQGTNQIGGETHIFPNGKTLKRPTPEDVRKYGCHI